MLWNHLEKEVVKDVQQWQVNITDETAPRQSLANYSILGKLLVEAVEQQPKEKVKKS